MTQINMMSADNIYTQILLKKLLRHSTRNTIINYLKATV
jgi:hypothetical protein